DEMRVKTMRIEGNTEAARKLRQEQSVINRRLENFAGSESAYPTQAILGWTTKAAQWAGEVVYDLGAKYKVPGAQSLAKYLKLADGERASNLLLSLGFFQKMASIDQVLLQASHFIAITALSP